MTFGASYEVNLSIDILPTDVLTLIFQYCDLFTLGKLNSTCKRFHSIINDDFFWSDKSKKTIVTNQFFNPIRERSLKMYLILMFLGGQRCFLFLILSVTLFLVPNATESFALLPFKERVRISSNWKLGKYNRQHYISYHNKYLPWLILEKKVLWLSQGQHIVRFKRSGSGVGSRNAGLVLVGHADDVCRFVRRGDLLISGGRDGCVCCWSTGTNQLMFRHLAHLYDVNAVDANDLLVVSGSKDNMFKVWQFSSLINNVTCQSSVEINLGDRVLCLSLSPCGSVCSIGTSGHYGVAPLHLFDMQRGSLLANLQGVLKSGAGTLDMSWDGPHTLLSAGYDTYIRLWDTRVGNIVLSWEDPHDSVVYCLQTDGGNAIMCGTSHHCRTQLWDKRITRRGVQMYFVQGHRSSPVYSLAFDPCELFIALDDSLHSFGFGGHRNATHLYMSPLTSAHTINLTDGFS